MMPGVCHESLGVAGLGDGDRPVIAVTSPWPPEAGNAGGTRFSFSVAFPLVDAAEGGDTEDAGAAAAAAEAAAAVLKASTGVRILIADDEPMPVNNKNQSTISEICPGSSFLL